MAPERREFVLHSLVERVVHFRPIQRHLRDVVAHVIGDCAETVRYDHAAHRPNISNVGEPPTLPMCPFVV